MVQLWLAKQTIYLANLLRYYSKTSQRVHDREVSIEILLLTTLLPIPRNAMSTSPSTEPLRRRFAGPGSSRSATPPMFKLLRLDNRYHCYKITYAEAAMVRLSFSLSMTLTFYLRQSELSPFFQGDDLKPNTWCQKMPRKICAPDNCNMVQVKTKTTAKTIRTWFRSTKIF